MYTKRKSLKNGIGGKKLIDMEKVYRQLDTGRSVQSVAKEHGVSKSTLYRRHAEYQERMEAVTRASYQKMQQEEGLPPLPEEIKGHPYTGRKL